MTDRRLALVMSAPVAILLGVFAIYPFIMAAFNSFNQVDLTTGAASFIGVDNYLDLARDPEIRSAFLRTIVWTVGNMTLQVMIGVSVALLLNVGLRGQKVARGLILFPYVVPAVVVALLFRYLLNDVTGLINYTLQQIGVIDGPLGWLSEPRLILPSAILINVWKYSPFFVIIVLARLQTISKELYQAAEVDGATAWQSFRAITIPAITPVVLVGLLLRTIWAVYDFDIPFLVSAGGGPNSAAVTVPLAIRSVAFEAGEIGKASALAVCMAVLLVIAAYFYLRDFESKASSGI